MLTRCSEQVAIQLGRIVEARARATGFFAHYPSKPHGARIQRALEAAKSIATNRHGAR
jgi:hypothetical protein